MRKKKLWSKSFGTRGSRVRVYEARAGGPLMRSIFINGKEERRSLGHKDKKLAEKQAYELLAQLLADEKAIEQGTLSLASLKRLYSESAAFMDKKERTRAEDARSLDRIVAFFGPGRSVDTLTDSDIRRYVQARRRGDPQLIGVAPNVNVGDRAIEKDLVALRTMLNWGEGERDRNGRRLLSENPLRGVSFPREKNPKRPVISHDEFLTLLNVADQVHPLLRLGLILAEGTGRRLSAWRQLRWSDIDFDLGTITWRAENDKKGFASTVPMPTAVRDALAESRKHRPAIGDAWVFPADKDPSRALSRVVLDQCLRRAFGLAGVPLKPGGMWHMFRRKWATERKGLPLADVAAAGGWRDPLTPQRIYQQADPETLRAVVSSPTHRLTGSR